MLPASATGVLQKETKFGEIKIQERLIQFS